MSPAGIPLILASASPRRKQLLARLGLEFSAVAPQVDERPMPGEAGALHAIRVAESKAAVVADEFADRAVLAADTVVVLGERMFGKPENRAVAREMLFALAGRNHLVLTAVALHFGSRRATHLEAARVTFVACDERLISWYLSTGEGDDKAGAYAVQGKGAVLIDRVEGNVEAVIGLPLAPLPGLFSRVGLALVADGDRLILTTSANQA